jgi:hypothetical protein
MSKRRSPSRPRQSQSDAKVEALDKSLDDQGYSNSPNQPKLLPAPPRKQVGRVPSKALTDRRDTI